MKTGSSRNPFSAGQLVIAGFLFYLLQSPIVGGFQNQKGAIQGVVLRGNTEVPAAGVRVAVYEGAGDYAENPLQTTTTDGNGTFKLSGLEPGGYSFRFSREGYADGFLGERHTNRGFFVRIVTVAPGRTTKDVVMRLAVTGSVSGAVRNDRGQPAVGVPVGLSRSIFGEDGTKVIEGAEAATTDDRGEYRIFGVESGHYYVFAGGNRRLVIKGNESVEPYARSYYPGVDDIIHAGSIELEPGGSIERLDFTLRTPKVYRVRGRIIDAATNLPPASAGIATSTGIGRFSQSYDPLTGNFEIDGLAPGEFKVSAWIPGSPCGKVSDGFGGLYTTNLNGIPSTAGAAGSTAVRLGEGDLENVLVVIRHGGCLKGSVTTDGKAFPNWFSLQLRPSGSSIHISVSMEKNGELQVDGLLPGQYQLLPLRLPDGFFLKAATYGGADVLDKPLDFKAEGSARMQILLSSRVAHLEGAVTAASGKPAAGILVVLVPEQRRDRYDLFVTTDTNEQGKFTLDNLAPGDYRAFAWESIEKNAWMNADVLDRYKQYGQPVYLAEESKETLNLPVIPVDNPK